MASAGDILMNNTVGQNVWYRVPALPWHCAFCFAASHSHQHRLWVYYLTHTAALPASPHHPHHQGAPGPTQHLCC